METITHNKNTLKIWTSMDEIPVDRYQVFSLQILMASNIGSSAESMLTHIRQIDDLVAKDQKEKARAMLANMQQAIVFAFDNINPEVGAFAAITQSVNGRPVTDLSPDGIKAFTTQMGKQGWTMAKIKGIVERIEDRLRQEFAILFPKRAATADSKDIHGHFKKRAKMQLDDIILETDSTDKLRQIEDFLLSMFNPEIFWGADGAEVKFVRSFDQVSALVNQSVSLPVKEMTARQFYNTLELLHEQYEKAKKARK